MRTILLFLLIPFFLHGQELRGKVFDSKTNEGLPFAVVYLVSSPVPHYGTQTDIEGNYSLKLNGKGKILVGIQFSGFESEMYMMEIDSVKIYSRDFHLCESKTSLVEIGVYFDKSSKPAPVTTSNDSAAVFVFQTSADTLKISNIRHPEKDSAVAHLLRSGRLIRYDDSTFYFVNGGCPDYIFYRKHGNHLDRIIWNYKQPDEFIFRKTHHGWKLSCNGVSAKIIAQ